MTKTIKIIAAIILATMLLSCLSVCIGAAEYRVGNNDVSESYAGGIYFDRFRQVPITGDGPTDAIAVALSQIGYQEGDSEDHFDGITAGSDNFTEFNYNFGSYGAGYGGSYYWCASFVSFSLYQSQCHDLGRLKDWCRDHLGEKDYVWREISCQKWVDQLKKFRMFKTAPGYGGSYVPSYGDLIFFTSNQQTSSHIGIVLYTDSNKVYTIEGNTSSGTGLDSNGGGVYFKSYDLTSTYILGYGVLPYERDESVAKIDYSGKNPTAGLYVNATNKYIYSSADVDSYESREYDYLLPKYSMFEITEVVSAELLRGVFTVDGKRVEGYIKNNSDRIIQLSDSRNEDKSDKTFKDSAIVNASGVHSFKKMCVDAYFVNDVAVDKKEMTVTDDGSFGITGWIGFASEIDSFGYEVGSVENKMFDASFAAATEDAVKLDANGGEFAQRFKITVDAATLSDGDNEVIFLVKLNDGRICILDTITVKKADGAVTPEDSTEDATEESTEQTTEQTTEQITETLEESSEMTTEEISEDATEQSTDSNEETTVEASESTGEIEIESNTEMGSEETSAPANNQKKKGCKSSVSAVGVVAMACIALAFVKKKED